LDLPPERPRPQRPAPSATASARAARDSTRVPQDTSRLPIEQTANRDSVLAMLPRDAGGHVDWVAAVRDSVLRPRPRVGRASTQGLGGRFGFDFVMAGPNPMFDAVFPHSSHGEWLDCAGCHPEVVRYRGQPVTMETIGNGESCGVCHETVAFPVAACYRCHPDMPPSGEATPTLGADHVIPRDSSVSAGGFPASRFPHWVHRIRYQCTACHPSPFGFDLGSTPMTMAGMQVGETCGACHDGETAFDLVDCTRCHAPPTPPEGPGS